MYHSCSVIIKNFSTLPSEARRFPLCYCQPSFSLSLPPSLSPSLPLSPPSLQTRKTNPGIMVIVGEYIHQSQRFSNYWSINQIKLESTNRIEHESPIQIQPKVRISSNINCSVSITKLKRQSRERENEFRWRRGGVVVAVVLLGSFGSINFQFFAGS